MKFKNLSGRFLRRRRCPCDFVVKLQRPLKENHYGLKPNALMELLENLFILEDPLDFFSSSPRNLKWKISQWVIENDDWKADDLFEHSVPTLVPTSDSCFCLEGLTSSEVRPDVDRQRQIRKIVNGALKPCQVELQETGAPAAIPFLQPSRSEEVSGERRKTLSSRQR